jgi:cullin 1
VLATGSWPLQLPACEFALPAQLLRFQTTFDAFYNEQHSGRKLVWLPTHSKVEEIRVLLLLFFFFFFSHEEKKGELKTFYTSKPYTLQCSTYQMGVLLLFEDADKLTMEQICIATQLKVVVLVSFLFVFWCLFGWCSR